MPDITMPYLPTSGTTSASGFNSDVYAPAASPNSLEVIDGWLATSNRDGAWAVPHHKIRPGSMTRAESVGATNNLDYFLLNFTSDYQTDGAFIPIPGAAKGCYVESASGVLIVSASVVVANSMDRSISDGGKLRLYYKGPTDSSFTAYATSQQQIANGGTTTSRRAYFDRQYCFDYQISSPAVGQWEFYIGVWFTGVYATISNLMTGRVRARTMSTIYYP